MSKIISALAFATLLSLPASAEITAPRILVTNASASCPAYEGYPDCHRDGSSVWTTYREHARRS